MSNRKCNKKKKIWKTAGLDVGDRKSFV